MTRDRIPWDQITDALLERYGAPAPRYTSYPTAPEWTQQFGPEDFKAALDQADGDPTVPISLYVHVPYCERRCFYCGCATWIAGSEAAYDQYLAAIEREVTAVSSYLTQRRTVNQIHWGGGTPTTLNTKRLTRMFEILTAKFSPTDAAEIAIEVNPAVTTPEQIDTLAQLGFNRVSLGVQDFAEDVQIAVGRLQTADETRRLIDRARTDGVGGINIDLMYGLPKQRQETWRQTLETVIRMAPDRLAVFGYAHVPWMRPHQKAINEHELPDTAARFALFRMAHDMLVDAGYIYIGMDHFARPDDPLATALKNRTLSRNFQGYTVLEAGALVGFGVTAISDIAGVFAQNQASLDRYLALTKTSGLTTYRGAKTTQEDRLRRHVITALMCNLHLDVSSVARRFDIDFWQVFANEKTQLNALAADGLITYDENEITVLPKGRLFVRHVGMVFDRYIQKSTNRKNTPRFSRTV
ncbi:MAG: oxygen-independent coproporphyrinogen III oxidase [Myxococcota bacterium]|nr:oxygen-independent coproporphyrinogen III oxidase [Myxococcota bacterium]